MDKSDYKNIWIYIEHDGKHIRSVSKELCSECGKIAAQSGDKLVGVVLGEIDNMELESLADYGVEEIIHVSGNGFEQYNTLVYSNAFAVLSRKYKPSAVFVGATINGRDFAPYFAACLETGCTSDATELIYNRETGDIEFVEPAAGGKIMAVITIPTMRPQVATIRPGTFQANVVAEKKPISIVEESVDFDSSKITTKLISFDADSLDPMLDIADAETIICIGNGIKEDSLDLYRQLAELLGGKLAGTRPVIDRGLLSYKLQIGQSGVMVKPKRYIAFGVSGAVNHVTGVDAELFIAVNTDPEAPIFNYCDYGIVGDMDEICKGMIAALQ